MLNKLFVGLVAAGALSIPLAGADPGDPQNGGGKGNGPGVIGAPPGSFTSQVAQEPDSNPPGIFGNGGWKSPGQFVKECKAGGCVFGP